MRLVNSTMWLKFSFLLVAAVGFAVFVRPGGLSKARYLVSPDAMPSEVRQVAETIGSLPKRFTTAQFNSHLTLCGVSATPIHLKDQRYHYSIPIAESENNEYTLTVYFGNRMQSLESASIRSHSVGDFHSGSLVWATGKQNKY